MPFEVPESWEWVTVGDIFTHNTGKALNSSNSQGEIMSYITTSNLYWNRFDLTVIKEMPFTESEVAKCTVTRGDLLVCEGGDIGRAAIWNYDFDIRIQNHIHRLRSIIQLNHLFYYHVFYLFKSLNLIGGKGVAIQGLSSSDLAKLLVPLPPISEQNRIVSELNRWLSVVDQIELDQYSLKNTIADIKNRILCLAISGKLVGQDISDEPAIELLKKINPSYISCDNRHYENIELSIPETWCWATVGDVFNHNTGKALNSSNHSGIMMDYITTSNLYWDRFDLSTVKQMPFTEKDLGKCTVTKGDLLICEGGDVGRSAIWNYNYDIRIQNHIHRLRGKANICVRYFFYVFMLYKQRNYIGGKGVAIQGLSSRDLNRLVIPLPPLNEQYRIAKSVDNLFSTIDNILLEL